MCIKSILIDKKIRNFKLVKAVISPKDKYILRQMKIYLSLNLSSVKIKVAKWLFSYSHCYTLFVTVLTFIRAFL